jgi:galactosamine-6-phosphate isomerase
MAQGFRIEVKDDYEAMSAEAARVVAETIQNRSHLVMALPTGSTPTRMYEMLAEKYRAGEFKTEKMIAVKLDEWGGIPMDDPGTCETYLKKHVIWPLDIPDKHFLSFESNSPNPESECTRIKNTLDNLGMIDLCILGLGQNGHVAMNEPALKLEARAHIANLADSTRHHTMLKDSPAVSYGLTLGMEDILGAEKILLLVSGAHKAQQLQQLLEGEIGPQFPASLLRQHKDVLVLVDSAAAGK